MLAVLRVVAGRGYDTLWISHGPLTPVREMFLPVLQIWKQVLDGSCVYWAVAKWRPARRQDDLHASSVLDGLHQPGEPALSLGPARNNRDPVAREWARPRSRGRLALLQGLSQLPGFGD